MTPSQSEPHGASSGGAPSSRRAGLAAALALLALAGGGIYLYLSTKGTEAGTARFVDRSREAGIDFKMSFLAGEQGEKFKINFYDHGAGVAVADYDGDGRDDIYFCNQLGPNALYHNEGGGRFADVTKRAGVGLDDRISVSAVFADIDNDGRQDLYVTTTRGGNALFRNRGDGTFEDITKAAGLELVAHSQAATFFDADGDGLLDLLVSNTARWTLETFEAKGKYYIGPSNFAELLRSPRETSRFYRNRGDAVFVDATEESGLANTGWAGDMAVFDYDGDGDLDVFVANMFGRSALYENDGKGRFRDVSKSVLEKVSWGTVGARAFDYDGDGRLDLFLVDMHSDMWMEASYYPEAGEEHKKFGSAFGPQVERGARTPESEAAFVSTYDADPKRVTFGNTLFHGLGGGKFEEVSDKAGVETLWPWGIAVGDFDGDGYEDAFLPSGMGHPYRYWGSPLLMNNGNGTFTDRAAEAGLEPPPRGRFLEEKIGGKDAARSSRSAATADFDGDGRVDLVVNNFNDRPLLLMNRWPRRHYVALRLTGTVGNRDAIGALARLHVGGRTLLRQVQAAGGYLAQSSKTLYFGLGDATKVEGGEIQWPSGVVSPLPAVRVDALTDIAEPKK